MSFKERKDKLENATAIRMKEDWDASMRRVRNGLQFFLSDELRSMTPFVRVRQAPFLVETTPSAVSGAMLTGPPLCVLLDRIKTSATSYVDRANASLDVLVGEWCANVNQPFCATERRPAPDQTCYVYEIVSTPLSWLLYARHGDIVNTANIEACVRHLIDLGADHNEPFCFRIATRQPALPPSTFWQESLGHDAETNANNGRSIISMCMEMNLSLSVIAMLLEHGAVFRPQELHMARRKYSVDEVDALFQAGICDSYGT